ncbi:hypothetical protein PAXRUDRAFT_823616 [Paxillus rubicundulus Ve08.2h10]|uniref:Glycosyltransferase 61 catalytic domain-containing protein n=1 Tax=Paxillus rubicundulus Ve08.2h10 TaxID=930991 RepID=A0A0D0E8M7_9AGAM|nr:hypothetical protein PAXRUDRAFT_823616 [Paxillus rubicundulus Ve08.2h10]
MAPLFRALSRRDAILILIGAFSMHFFTSLAPLTTHSVVINTGVHHQLGDEVVVEHPPQNDQELGGLLGYTHILEELDDFSTDSSDVDPRKDVIPSNKNGALEQPVNVAGGTDLSGVIVLPETTIVEHVPGWTLFRDIYMANGTFLILSSSLTAFPDVRYMTSTGLAALNTPENIALREPTPWNMDFVTPEEALQRWGDHPASRRVWSVEGNTLLFNDPPQFLAHYYHFCAELLLGTWSFWTGAAHPEPPPPIHRAIFPHSTSAGWRDGPGFNSYFLRAVFPSLTVEVEDDWNDRIVATSASIDSGIHRAWHFPYLLLADRSAAFRGSLCGGQNQRTASESVDGLIARSKLDRNGLWWRSIRNAVWRFAGVTEQDEDDAFRIGRREWDDKLETVEPPEFEETEKIVITYISRQSVRRRLIPEDHEGLVEELEALVRRKNAEIKDTMAAGGGGAKEWELNVVRAEQMTKDEQVHLVARTTILLGVHGNGLSHLILMPHTKMSAVIEMFYPGGFAHDYEWTTRALGMRHFAVWNDTYFTEENTPRVNYPQGFQGEKIPIYGPNVASIIERRIAREL